MAIKKFRILSFKKQKPIVALKKISLSFGKRQILDDINLYNDDEKKFENIDALKKQIQIDIDNVKKFFKEYD